MGTGTALYLVLSGTMGMKSLTRLFSVLWIWFKRHWLLQGIRVRRDLSPPVCTYAFGQTVVDWKPHKHLELFTITRNILRAGSREDILAAVAPTNEPVLDSMSPDPDDRKGVIPLLPDSSIGAYELWQLHKQKQELRGEYLDHWEATTTATGTNRPVDAIISPAAPFAAPPHGKYM